MSAAPARAPRRWPPIVDHLVGLVAVVVLWRVYIAATDAPAFVLPTPESVGAAILDLAASGQLWTHLGFTLSNMLWGFLIGAGGGIAAGFALAHAPRVERWIEGPLLILQTAPKIALAPLFVIWFGLGVASKIALVVSLTFFPVLVGALVGVRSLDPRLRDLADVLRLSGWTRAVRIELPAALPEIFVGLRIGAVQAVVGAILGEWMSGRMGLGYLMTFATATYKTPLLFAAVILTIGLGLAVHLLIAAGERRLLGWKP
jgi:NitT/TauT family transport system permease protein